MIPSSRVLVELGWYSTYESVAPGRWVRTSPGGFCLACQDMSWLCCIQPAAELPIPRLVLSFPPPPTEQEHCPSPAQNSPYG